MSSTSFSRRLPTLLNRSIPKYTHRISRSFTTSKPLNLKIDATFVSQISAAEQTISGQQTQIANGPAAVAQSHTGQELTRAIISEITKAEAMITGQSNPVKQGPTSIAQSMITSGSNTSNTSNPSNTSTNNTSNISNTSTNNTPASGVLDSATISKITEKEKEITGEDGAVRGGPTAQAQKHVGENIGSQNLHDITEGEKKITGGERVKGGPTSVAQSSLGQNRN